MSPQTGEQATQLDAAMRKLRTLPTPELIFESARLRLADPVDESSKDAFRRAVAGSIAA